MHQSMFARILICSMSLAISAVVILAQDAGSKSAKTDHQPDFLQIITPHEGVDFTGFSADLVQVVKRNWYAKMPSEAKQNINIKGRVVVGFGIQKDGQLSNVPKVEVSSGNKALDEAAVSAVRASAPFDHLPEAFKGPNIDLRLTFLYNQPLSALNP
jgi:TonB family protein